MKYPDYIADIRRRLEAYQAEGDSFFVAASRVKDDDGVNFGDAFLFFRQLVVRTILNEYLVENALSYAESGVIRDIKQIDEAKVRGLNTFRDEFAQHYGGEYFEQFIQDMEKVREALGSGRYTKWLKPNTDTHVASEDPQFVSMDGIAKQLGNDLLGSIYAELETFENWLAESFMKRLIVYTRVSRYAIRRRVKLPPELHDEFLSTLSEGIARGLDSFRADFPLFYENTNDADFAVFKQHVLEVHAQLATGEYRAPDAQSP